MRPITTRLEKIHKKINSLKEMEYKINVERDEKVEELEKYEKRHKGISFDGLETKDIKKLKKIYAYMDKRYPVDFQGGLRCDDRGMALTYWIDDDPEYLIFHLTSNHPVLIFSGSTSWITKAATLQEKINVLMQVKKDIIKILKETE